MMIQKISIKNFKSIKSIVFDTGQINVIIGENGSGKSNILEGIALGGAASLDLLTNEFLFSRGIRVTEVENLFFSDSKLISINLNKAIVTAEDISVKIDIRYIKSKGLYNYSKAEYIRKFPLLFKKVKGINEDDHLAKLKYFSKEQNIDEDIYFEKFNEQFTNFLETNITFGDRYLESFLIFSPDVKALRNFYDEAQVSPLGINGEGLFNELKRLFNLKSHKKINQIINNLKLIDWFDGMEINKDSFIGEKKLLLKDKFLSSKIQYIDQRSTNEGFLFLLFYLTLFISEKTPKFFAIDNIEASFNPKMCIKLMEALSKLAVENNKQVLFTTHNPYILDGLNIEDEKQRLFVVRRNLNGETVINRVQPKQKLTIPLSEAWMSGLLGGLPNNF